MAADLLVVGTGLIGTSVGLALRGAYDVVLADRSADDLAVAVQRGAGRAWDRREPFAHCLVAVPPSAVIRVLRALTDHPGTFCHVASVQRGLQQEVAAAGLDRTRICGSHPMAGKEQSGPAAATGSLFVGRPWVLCPDDASSPQALAATRDVAEGCGAEPVQLTAEQHDAAVALTSHLPQVAASAVAAVLAGSGRHSAPTGQGEELALAGPGLQDTTRIAASDPRLWVELLQQNAGAVAPLVRQLAGELSRTAQALEQQDLGAVEDLLRRGNAGRRLVPRKRGEHDRDFVVVPVAVPDEPGQLAGVLVSAAQAGINVEDVRVEHLPGRPTGVIELLVHLSAQAQARSALTAAGWDVVGG